MISGIESIPSLADLTRSDSDTGTWNGTVLIPTCDRPEMLAVCLESLRRQLCKPRQILVLDQSRDDRTQRVCDSYGVSWQWVGRQNKSAALNLGVRSSTTRYFAVIDDDCVADPRWTETLAAALHSQGKHVVTGRVLAGQVELGAVLTRLHDSLTRRAIFRVRLITPIFVLSGCNFGFERGVFETAGPFNEAYGPGSRYLSSDDNEWSYRVLRKGYAIHYEPSCLRCPQIVAIRRAGPRAHGGLWVRSGRLSGKSLL